MTVRLRLFIVLAAVFLSLPASPASACDRVANIPIGCDPSPRPPPPRPGPSSAAQERELLRLITGSRESHRVRALETNPAAMSIARAHARRMRDEQALFADRSTTSGGNYRRLGRPSAIGQVVGFGDTVRIVHRGFMETSYQRRSILRRAFSHLGVGIVQGADRTWVAVVLIGGRSSSARSPAIVSEEASGRRVAEHQRKARAPMIPAQVTQQQSAKGWPKWPAPALMSGMLVALIVRKRFSR